MQVIQKDLADILGISTRRIQQLAVKNGMFKSKTDGKYNVAECVQEYINFKIESATSGNSDLDYWEEKAKHEEAKRKITQMKLSRMKRESFNAADVEDAWAVLLLGFKEELQALPHKLAPMLIGLDDMAEIDRMLESEINGALLSLSQFDLDKIESSDDMTEEAEDDEDQHSQIPAGAVEPAPASGKANGKRVGGRKPKNSRR